MSCVAGLERQWLRRAASRSSTFNLPGCQAPPWYQAGRVHSLHTVPHPPSQRAEHTHAHRHEHTRTHARTWTRARTHKCTHTWTHEHTRTHTGTHTNTRTRTRTHTSTQAHTWTRTGTHAHEQAHTSTQTHTWTRTCMHTNTRTQTNAHIWTHTRAHTHRNTHMSALFCPPPWRIIEALLYAFSFLSVWVYSSLIPVLLLYFLVAPEDNEKSAELGPLALFTCQLIYSAKCFSFLNLLRVLFQKFTVNIDLYWTSHCIGEMSNTNFSLMMF